MNIRKTKLSAVSNLLFFAFSTFTILFIWINYYYRNFKKALTPCIIISIILIIIYILIKIIIYKKHNKNLPIYTIEKLQSALLLTPDEIVISDIISLFKLDNLLKINNSHYIDNSKDYLFILNKQVLSNDDMYPIIKNRHFNSITIFCIQSSIDIKVNNCTIEIVNINDIYSKYSHIQYPISHYTFPSKIQKMNIIEFLSIIINKSKSKKYLSYGLLILVTSMLTPYSIYYIIVGTLLIILSVISRFVSISTQKINHEK